MSEAQTETVTRKPATRGMTWVNVIVAVIGLWIAVSSFVFTEMSQASYWNNIVIGIAIVLFAGYNAYRLSNDMETSVGSVALVTLLGLWMIATPFLYDTSLTSVLWSDVIAGVVVALLAGYNTYTGRKAARSGVAGT